MDQNRNSERNICAVAVVVTYNRKALLRVCIDALLGQTYSCDIVIVDNASTDGTKTYLQKNGFLKNARIHYLLLDENVGGSGGFHYGVKYCMSFAWDWFWLMDDDAKPNKKALEVLLRNASNSNHIYGSVATAFENGRRKLCFPARVRQRNKGKFIEFHELLEDLEEVAWVPFLGFFIHRHMVQMVGLPALDFFILDDDVEYSERARRKGAKILLVKESIIDHPLQKTTVIRFMGKRVYYRSMPPWKIYYDVRNKVTIAKRYYGTLLWTQTIPGILLRAFYSIFHEKKRIYSLYVYTLAVLHGLFNKSGRSLLPPFSKEP